MGYEKVRLSTSPLPAFFYISRPTYLPTHQAPANSTPSTEPSPHSPASAPPSSPPHTPTAAYSGLRTRVTSSSPPSLPRLRAAAAHWTWSPRQPSRRIRRLGRSGAARVPRWHGRAASSASADTASSAAYARTRAAARCSVAEIRSAPYCRTRGDGIGR